MMPNDFLQPLSSDSSNMPVPACSIIDSITHKSSGVDSLLHQDNEQETKNRTSDEGASKTSIENHLLVFSLANGRGLGRRRKRKRKKIYGTKQTAAEFFRATSGASPRPQADRQIISDLNATIFHDRQPLLPNSTRPLTSSSETTTGCLVSEEGQSHVSTIDVEGSIDMFKCSTTLSDFNVPIITSSSHSSTTRVAMTSYHITPVDDSTRPSASSHLPGSLNDVVDARIAVHHPHDVPGSSRHYAHHLGQTSRASYTDHGSSLELHSTSESLWNSPVDGADLNSEFLTDISRDHLDGHTQLVNRIIPNNSIHADHSYTSNGPQYRLIKITEHNINLFYCYNTSTRERIGPVDVYDVETSAVESFIRSCFLPIHGGVHTGYSGNTGRLYQGSDNGGLDIISPLTSTASTLSDNHSEASQSPSFSQFPTRFSY